MSEVRKLPTVEFEGKEWTFDERLKQIRRMPPLFNEKGELQGMMEFEDLEDMYIKVGGYNGKERILEARIRGKMRLLPLKEVI